MKSVKCKDDEKNGFSKTLSPRKMNRMFKSVLEQPQKLDEI